MIENFFNWINDRHEIYLHRVRKMPPPWSNDPIFNQYKFTNPFRENDRVTIWMRDNWTNPNHNKPHGQIIFNCCLFRMIGTTEFANQHGWVDKFNPTYTKEVIEDRLKNKLRTFTGAYIITNQGIKKPKSEVVVDSFLTPIWEEQETLAKVAEETQSLQQLHMAMGNYLGWGGGGFMSYEVVTALNYTPVLDKAKDRFSWANAGPGAKRGLNRIFGRELTKSIKQENANEEMKDLLSKKHTYLKSHVPIKDVDMRTIEHSLCEFDKYQRILNKEGTPRSRYNPYLDGLKHIPIGGVQ